MAVSSKIYKIEIKKSVEKELRSIPDSDLKKILNTIQSLATNPRPVGSQKLTAKNSFRVRVGVYRIIYEIEDSLLVVTVIRVAHRKEVYK